ncbi:hypothetical protein IQ07DRAFT_266306 [Pyrenochaeta sp. DS3sAY3a]|nr:hypothetical protein IQ07DRAFT_266306 [Pyrenochaeta sp. DS3sAY3a]
MDGALSALLVFLPQILAAPLLSNQIQSDFISTRPRDAQHTSTVRIVALTCSTIGMVASMVAFYWFFRMEKQFRHRLIMILIYGDLVRALWYFIFAMETLVRGTVQTPSGFCQSTGFFTQYGTETNYAVLVIAIHSALQVFRPRAQSTSGGLYPYRRYVYAGAFVLPTLMASLAFVNEPFGYYSLGAFCTLPIRPFWYRLALAWIPRYLIALIIIGLAIAIYVYVHVEFRSYSKVSKDLRNSTELSTTICSQDENLGSHVDSAIMMGSQPGQGRRASSIAHDAISSPRRTSSVSFTFPVSTSNHIANPSSTIPASLPGSSPDLARRDSETVQPLHSSQDTIQPPKATATANAPSSRATMETVRSVPSQDAKTLVDLESRTPSPTSSLAQRLIERQRHRHMARQRARIHRQLRLMFIYPLAYALMWLLPFIQHCMMYQDKFVHHPLFFLRIGSTISVASIGLVDALIFSIREKPWRSIPTSDGTFWGSFAVWRNPGTFDETFGLQRTGTETGPRPGSRKMVRRSASSNDCSRVAAEQARLRLGLEQEERVQALRTRLARRPTLMTFMSEKEEENGEESGIAGYEDVERVEGEKLDKGKGKVVDN